MTNKFKFIVPFTVLISMLTMLGFELFATSHAAIQSDMIGEQVPAFSLPGLRNANNRLSQNDLRGKISIINIWASWCSACKSEHALLMKISRNYHIPIYGILYRDDPSNALRYLNKRGDPYKEVGNDEYGDIGIDFGVYGTPETFVISPTGKILYRQIGAMNEDTWKNVIYPLIKHHSK